MLQDLQLYNSNSQLKCITKSKRKYNFFLQKRGHYIQIKITLTQSCQLCTCIIIVQVNCVEMYQNVIHIPMYLHMYVVNKHD